METTMEAPKAPGFTAPGGARLYMRFLPDGMDEAFYAKVDMAICRQLDEGALQAILDGIAAGYEKACGCHVGREFVSKREYKANS